MRYFNICKLSIIEFGNLYERLRGQLTSALIAVAGTRTFNTILAIQGYRVGCCAHVANAVQPFVVSYNVPVAAIAPNFNIKRPDFANLLPIALAHSFGGIHAHDSTRGSTYRWQNSLYLVVSTSSTVPNTGSEERYCLFLSNRFIKWHVLDTAALPAPVSACRETRKEKAQDEEGTKNAHHTDPCNLMEYLDIDQFYTADALSTPSAFLRKSYCV